MNYFINDDHIPNKFPQSSQKKPSLLEKLLFRLSKKWIAGYNIEDALSYALNANEKGLCCIINYLGEELKNQDRIKKTHKKNERKWYGRINLDKTYTNRAIFGYEFLS